MTLKQIGERMNQIGERIENSKITQFLRRALSSCFFPIVTAVVSVGSYYLGWDIVNIWYLCICGTAIMVCCKDVSPVLCLILFFSLLPSPQHSPKFGDQSSNYLVSAPILAQEIIGVIFFLGTVVFRLVSGIVRGKFKITPMFWGIIGLSAAFVLNGIFYSKYTPMNLLYGAAISAVIIVFYVFCYCNFGKSEETFRRIAYYFVAVAATVTLELGITYLTNLSQSSEYSWRHLLKFGWGTYNQAGLLLTFAIPSWFYLAGKHKYGYFFLLGAVANVGLCFLSQARQAMLMSLVIFCACSVWILIWDKGKKRIIDLIIIGVLAALAVILAGIMHEKLLVFFSSALNKDSLSTGNGRTGLWKEGWQNFLRKPLFGIGFYDPQAVEGEVGYFVPGDLSHAIPRMCHNTIFEIMSACGLVGLLAYAAHRTLTVISFINNVTHERVLIAATACVILLLSLLDNHFFGVFPTIIYSLLIAMLSATEKEKQPKKAKREEVTEINEEELNEQKGTE